MVNPHQPENYFLPFSASTTAIAVMLNISPTVSPR